MIEQGADLNPSPTLGSPLVSPGISGMRARQQIFAILLESLGVWGSLWFIRWLRPVFRIGRDPAVSLFLGRKIPDIRDGAISSAYGNGPTTVLDHFRVKFGFFAHPNNTRLQQNGSISNSAATIKLSTTGGPIAGPAGLTGAGPACGLSWFRSIGASAGMALLPGLVAGFHSAA
jgi:hypothetical protein